MQEQKRNKQPALKAHDEGNLVDVDDPQVWRTRKTYINDKEVLASDEKNVGNAKTELARN